TEQGSSQDQSDSIVEQVETPSIRRSSRNKKKRDYSEYKTTDSDSEDRGRKRGRKGSSDFEANDTSDSDASSMVIPSSQNVVALNRPATQMKNDTKGCKNKTATRDKEMEPKFFRTLS